MTRELRWLIIAGGALAVALTAVVLVARSEWLREQVRLKIISAVEQASGGKVEIERFDYEWKALRAGVRGLVVRGTETAPQAPLFTAGQVSLAIDVRSWIGRDVELRELVVEKPEIHIYVNADGSTNIPGGRKKGGRNPVENLLDLKIARLRVEDGLFEYDSKRIPVNVRGEAVRAALDYRRQPERYDVDLHAGKLRVEGYAEGTVDVKAALFGNRGDFDANVVLAGGTSAVHAKGRVEDFKSPKVAVDYELRAAAADLKVKVLRAGAIESKGTAELRNDGAYEVAGTIAGNGVWLEGDNFVLRKLNSRGRLRLTPGLLRVDELHTEGFGGRLDGSATLEEWRSLKASGRVQSPLSALAAAAKTDKLAWDGQVDSSFEFSGEIGRAGFRNSALAVQASLGSLPGQLPGEGSITASWKQGSGEVRVEPSSVRIPGLTMHGEGTLGKSLTFALVTTDVRQVEPYLGLFGAEGVEFPVELDHGQIRAEGVVTGALTDPTLDGRLEAERAVFRENLVDSAQVRFIASSHELNLPQVSLTQAGSSITGSLRLGLKEWKATAKSALAVQSTFRSVDLRQLVRLTSAGVDAAGRVDATLNLRGTLGAPEGSIRFTSANATLAGENLHRLTGEIRNPDATHATLTAAFDLASSRVTLNGAYTHARGEWRRGTAEFQVKSGGMNAGQLAIVRKVRPEFNAGLTFDARLRAQIGGDEVLLRAVDGTLDATGIRDHGVTMGSVRLRSVTSDETVQMAIDGQLDKSPLSGQASARLTNNYPGAGKLDVKALPLAFLTSALSSAEPGKRRLELEGAVDATVRWRGSLRNLKASSAQVTIPNIEVRPRDESSEFMLRNSSPLQFDIDSTGVQVRSARLSAKETALTLAGVYSFGAKNPWDLSLSGVMNLGVLNSFDPELTAAGHARLNANLRGTAENPTVSGRMTIEKASIFLKGIPNGVENANGSIYFDQNRANVESFTGTTGGGTFSLGGFIGFGKGELSYRLQANAQDVRVRYPEGVSTTLDAALSLTGSSYASLLSGVVTVERSGFRSSGDFGSLIAGSANPIPIPASQNAFLRNLQFDVRVRTSPNATFQTDYTQDIQTEADLRVRGSPAKPVVLGTVKVNQGEVNFFGNRYTISSGEILFFSTVAIQPSINLDLETRIRGVVVYINVNGPLNRLNINYRSEPPLQSSEILALLTVGRAPTATSGNLPSTSAASTSAGSPLSDASNTLLGGALSATVSSRVERFFGASRIKIDPNMTGVENIPQARLTIEQSLSRDITLTYSTNLSRSSQQIVRMEWDLSRQWSVIAVRDENGSFGVDFLFRRRFR